MWNLRLYGQSKGNHKINSKNDLLIGCYCSFYIYFVKQNMDISCHALSTTFERKTNQKWHDKQYKKAHLGTALKANPFGEASHAKGIQPNSAIRKCVRAQLIKNGKKITALVPKDGYLNSIEENDEFKIVRVASVSLLAFYEDKKERPRL
ncbi:unnamed protein product [Nyctereutes procyonoides]|uniref:Small ribosomal subunit protein uS12 n=1 Tax=Nyctereutes procyonoides TaxID=34880 RepID=A0A811Y3Q1_NYCPR|nr:unnamed protein product [Nyctereutes procyonoides]